MSNAQRDSSLHVIAVSSTFIAAVLSVIAILLALMVEKMP